MRKLAAALVLTISASASSPVFAQRPGARCLPITDATRAGFYVIYGEKGRAVEGSSETEAPPRKFNDPERFFEIAFSAANVRAECATIGWRVEPYGPNPVDAADFGGRFPSGVVTMWIPQHEERPSGEIEIWVPDDRRAERPEQFRIVLTNPRTGRPLAGKIGLHDDGLPVFRGPAARFDMHNRLVMTVEDAPEQRIRR